MTSLESTNKNADDEVVILFINDIKQSKYNQIIRMTTKKMTNTSAVSSCRLSLLLSYVDRFFCCCCMV